MGVGSYDTGTTFFNGWIQQYVGGFVPIFASDPISNNVYNNVASLLARDDVIPSTAPYEPEVYPKLRPRLEQGGLTVSGVELRELPRMLRTTSRFFRDQWRYFNQNARGRRIHSPFMSPQSNADQFLNANFGWVPFLSDLERLQKVYQEQGAYLSRITRGNGQWQRRKKVLAEEEFDIEIASGNGYSVIPSGPLFDKMSTPDGLGRRAYWQQTLHFKKKVYAEGSFKYYRPEFDEALPGYHSQMMRLRRITTLYGARVSPSAVYNVTPWTWLIDYFANVGDGVDIITDMALDSIVARYIYLMYHYERSVTLKQVINFKSGPVAMTWNRKISTKLRREADTPYGFGLSGALSPRQMIVIAALGLTTRG
jgi:hypothetical protein